MYNSAIYKVTDDIYRSGRVDRIVFRGLNTIICLENDENYVEDEEDFCKYIGKTYVRYPLSSITRPKLVELFDIVRMMKEMKKPLLVRCRRGIDRTGFAVAAYRIRAQHWTLEDAYKECVDFGHRRWLYWWWKKSLKEVASL